MLTDDSEREAGMCETSRIALRAMIEANKAARIIAVSKPTIWGASRAESSRSLQSSVAKRLDGSRPKLSDLRQIRAKAVKNELNKACTQIDLL